MRAEVLFFNKTVSAEPNSIIPRRKSVKDHCLASKDAVSYTHLDVYKRQEY